MIPVAQTALGYWELQLDGEDTRRPFLALADWLVREAAPHTARLPGSSGSPSSPGLAWYTQLPRPKYGLAAGWPSAMGQGEAISVLLRAHALTRTDAYLETAGAALQPLMIDVADGGLSRELDGELVLEEYPSERPCAVLNGWIFALFGVHELATVTGDERAQRLFERSATSLITLLPRYDVGWWSLYSLYDHGRRDLAKPFYQRLHPVLLDALNLIAPADRLVAMARRWESQITPLGLARSAANKIGFRLYRAATERGKRS